MGVGDWLRRQFPGTSPPEPEPFSPPAQCTPTTPARRLEVSSADAERMERAVEVLLRHPEAEESDLPALLAECGLTLPEVWRAYQFLAIAFTHVVMRGRAQFQPGYVLFDPDTGVKSSHLLAEQPMYVAGVASAERRLAEGRSPQQLLPIYGRSAEYHAICQGGVLLTNPVLIPFRG
jgi:hypothetical protein